jgi:hypothetical protein
MKYVMSIVCKKIINAIVYTVLLCVLLTSENICGGKESKKGTAGAQELLIPFGARGLSLGGSTVSTATGIEAVNWNPAGLSITDNSIEMFFSHLEYIADLNVNAVVLNSKLLDYGNLAFTIKSLDFGKIEETTEDAPEGTGYYFSPTYLTFGLSYSKRISDRLSAGVTGKYVYEKFYSTLATGVAFDAGIQYVAGSTGLIFGIVIKNIGPSMKFEGTDLDRNIYLTSEDGAARVMRINSAPFEMPSSLELGFAFNKNINDQNRFILSGSFENNNYGNDLYKTGLEYSYDNMIFLRGGYILVPEEINYVYGVSCGIGIHQSIEGINFVIDYGYRPTKFFNSNSIFNIIITF